MGSMYINKTEILRLTNDVFGHLYSGGKRIAQEVNNVAENTSAINRRTHYEGESLHSLLLRCQQLEKKLDLSQFLQDEASQPHAWLIELLPVLNSDIFTRMFEIHQTTYGYTDFDEITVQCLAVFLLAYHSDPDLSLFKSKPKIFENLAKAWLKVLLSHSDYTKQAYTTLDGIRQLVAYAQLHRVVYANEAEENDKFIQNPESYWGEEGILPHSDFIPSQWIRDILEVLRKQKERNLQKTQMFAKFEQVLSLTQEVYNKCCCKDFSAAVHYVESAQCIELEQDSSFNANMNITAEYKHLNRQNRLGTLTQEQMEKIKTRVESLEEAIKAGKSEGHKIVKREYVRLLNTFLQLTKTMQPNDALLEIKTTLNDKFPKIKENSEIYQFLTEIEQEHKTKSSGMGL